MGKRKPPRNQPFVLRVASFSNFNHTAEERQEVLKILKDEYPLALPFVNTCSGDRLMVKDWPIIITGNPWLEEFIPPSKKDPGFKMIKAVRLKYVHDAVPEVEKAFVQGLRWCDRNGIPALITMMRFNRIALMYRYVKDPEKAYGDGGQFRARSDRRFTRAMAEKLPEDTTEAKRKKHRVFKAMDRGVRFFVPFVPPWSQFKKHIRKDLYFVCDGKLRGCPWCQNCNWLTYGKRSFEGVNRKGFMPPWVPYQVNLRASRPRGGRISPKGMVHCHHDCPDCFARYQLAQSGGIPSRDIAQNEKQKGATSHPFLREFKVPKRLQKEIDRILKEREAGWPTMIPDTPGFTPGLASNLFGLLPFLLPSPDTDTQWVDHAIDAFDKYDDAWRPAAQDAEGWLRARMKNWTEKQKSDQKRIRNRTNKILAKYLVKVSNNLADRFTAAFNKRTKKMGLDPQKMADLVDQETKLLRTLVDQFKAGDFGTLEAYISHLRVTAALLESEKTSERLVKGLSRADEKVIAKAVKEGVITKEAGESLLRLAPVRLSKRRRKAMVSRARKVATRVEREVLRGI
jgi:hypothetical protein